MATFTRIMPEDKWLHLFVGVILAMIATPLTGEPVAGFCVALGAGMVTEWIIDGWMKLGDFEANDFYATAGGGAIGAGVAYALPLIGKIV